MYSKIKKIIEAGEEETYDVAMESPHNNYIANGIVVHNSNLAHKLMKEIIPSNFDELSAISSLLRPGPLKMGMPTEFANRKWGKPDETGHVWSEEEIPECIRSILIPTKGIICLAGDSEVLTIEGLMPIEDIVNNKINTKVLSFNETNQSFEWKDIINHFDNGIHEVVELEFDNGNKIKCTSNHLILTKNRGWIEAGNLDEKDEIIFSKNYNMI